MAASEALRLMEAMPFRTPGLGLVAPADGDDLSVAGPESEPELAGTFFVHLELGHDHPRCFRRCAARCHHGSGAGLPVREPRCHLTPAR